MLNRTCDSGYPGLTSSLGGETMFPFMIKCDIDYRFFSLDSFIRLLSFPFAEVICRLQIRDRCWVLSNNFLVCLLR